MDEYEKEMRTYIDESEGEDKVWFIATYNSIIFCKKFNKNKNGTERLNCHSFHQLKHINQNYSQQLYSWANKKDFTPETIPGYKTSLKAIAEETGCTKKTAARRLNDLTRCGAIIKIEKIDRSNLVLLLSPDLILKEQNGYSHSSQTGLYHSSY